MAMGTVKRTSVVDKDNTRISELKIHAYLASVKPTTTSVSKIHWIIHTSNSNSNDSK